MSSRVIKTVFFDFDGVLSKDHFYANLESKYSEVHKFIQKKVFGSGVEMVNQWMRGQLTSDQVNKFISENTNIDFDELNKLFIESVKAMRLEIRLISLAKQLKTNSFRIALVTDNMDVFNAITVRHHKLDNVFPVIVNSFDHGVMKHEANGKLFDIAMAALGEGDYSNTLLIDDSVKTRSVFEQKGGLTFAYVNYLDFAKWASKNLFKK